MSTTKRMYVCVWVYLSKYVVFSFLIFFVFISILLPTYLVGNSGFSTSCVCCLLVYMSFILFLYMYLCMCELPNFYSQPCFRNKAVCVCVPVCECLCLLLFFVFGNYVMEKFFFFSEKLFLLENFLPLAW